jgi:CYTH domain-containing protein
MPSEIERKYLVLKEAWKPSTSGVLYRQGYLSSTIERVVRVRIAGDRAYLTVKGPATGVTRLEFEYSIPIDDAATMLDLLCERPLIEKTRYREEFEGHRWEVDEFHGNNSSLVIAEIELANASEEFAMPPWAATEVSDDPRYLNANLVRNPYKNWRT